MAEERQVLTAPEINRVLTRMAHEILESNKGSEDLILLGIATRGIPLAVRLAKKIAEVEPAVQAHAGVDGSGIRGSLDITLHRDDLHKNPTRGLQPTDIPACGIDGKVVVLIDDVLATGRTIRAALDALSDLGRPRAVRLAVLVDRGHRELPIRADHVGKNLPTSHKERVRVLLEETDGKDAVIIQPPADTSAGATEDVK